MPKNSRTSWESTSGGPVASRGQSQPDDLDWDGPVHEPPQNNSKMGCSTLLLFLMAAVAVAVICMLLSGGFWLFDV